MAKAICWKRSRVLPICVLLGRPLIAGWLLLAVAAGAWSDPQADPARGPNQDGEGAPAPGRGGLVVTEHGPRTAPGDFLLADPATQKPERQYLVDLLTDRNRAGVFPASRDAFGVVTKTATGRQMHVWTPLGVELWADGGGGYRQVVQCAWFEVEVWDGQKWVVAPRRAGTVTLSRSERNVAGGGLVDLHAEGRLEGLAEAFADTATLGFDGKQYQHKFSFELPASAEGRKRRAIWKVRLAPGCAGLIRNSAPDHRIECGPPAGKGKERAKQRPVRLSLGDLDLDWAAAIRVPRWKKESDPDTFLPRVELMAPWRTVCVYFEEAGTTGAISIDPTLSITTSSSTITVDDGTRKWVWKNEATKPTVAEFYHDSVAGGTDNCAATCSYYIMGFGLANEYSNNLDSSAAFSLLASSSTVARIYRRCTGTYGNASVETWQTVWASGRCYSHLDWHWDAGVGYHGAYAMHYNSSAPQVYGLSADSSAAVISDSSSNNYPGASFVPYSASLFTAIQGPWFYGSGDYANYEWTKSGGFQGCVLVSCADYRATAATRDAELNDYRNPDPLNDGQNAGKVLIGGACGDGFDEAWGCYGIAASGGQVEVRFDDKRGGNTSYAFKGLRLKITAASAGWTPVVEKKVGDSGTYVTLSPGTDYAFSELGGGEYAFEYLSDITGTGAGGRTYFRFGGGSSNQPPTVWDQSFSVNENAPNGTVVGTVAASDPDTGDSLTYTITAGNTGGAFAINSATGELAVANSSALDYETSPWFYLTVHVADTGGLMDTATVTIGLNDVSEGTPPTVYGFTAGLDENAPYGTYVSCVMAYDPDPGDSLTYSITAGNDNSAFTIDSAGGIYVSNSSALDFETTPTFYLTVQATDTAGLTGTGAVTISLNNLSEGSPPTVYGNSFSVNENAPYGTYVGSVSAYDPDGGSLTYDIVGGNNDGAFYIDSMGGIYVSNSSALDFETTPTFYLTVQATDSTGLSGTGTVTVSLNDVSEGGMPPVVYGFTTTLDENTASGTYVSCVMGYDPEGGSLAYAITGGNDGSAFYIDSMGGIYVSSSSALDYEMTPVFYLTVQAMDPTGLTSTAAVTIYLNNVGETPPMVYDTTFTVNENAPDWTFIGCVYAADPDGGSGMLEIVAGNENYAFYLGYMGYTGYLYVMNSSVLDFETTPVFTLIVRATDSAGLTGTGTVTVNLNNVNEWPPTVNDQWFNVNENAANGAVVGVVLASDPDPGDSVAFSITSGNIGNAFAINAATGELTVANSSALDFETTPSFSLTVQVVDTGGWTDYAAVTVSLNDLADGTPPIVYDAWLSIDENPMSGAFVGYVMASDPDSANLTFAITGGNEGSSFSIWSSGCTGYLYVSTNSPALDFETTPNFTLTVQATDPTGLTGTGMVTVSLNNLNEPPRLTLTNVVTTLPEDTDTSLGVKVADVVVTDDALGTNALSLMSDSMIFEIVGDELRLQPGATLDFETKPTHYVLVSAYDTAIGGTMDGTADLTLTVTNVNEAPRFYPSDRTFTVNENTPSGTAIGYVYGYDPDGDSIAYELISGNEDYGFWIDATGCIYVSNMMGNALDYETAPQRYLTVRVTDPAGLAATVDVTINVLDVSDTTPPVVSDATLTVQENAPYGSWVGLVSAYDPDPADAGNLTFEIVAGGDGAFSIAPYMYYGGYNPGYISVGMNTFALDYETTRTFVLTVRATDTTGRTGVGTITIDLLDVLDVIEDQSFSLAENTANGTPVGTVVARDPDVGDIANYYMMSAVFAINPTTGVISVTNQAMLDYETTQSFTLDVWVTSTAGHMAAGTVTIALTDVDEGPLTIFDNLLFFNVNENAPNGTFVGHVEHDDPDILADMTWSITAGNTGDAFAIDSSGRITVANSAALDYETNPYFILNVEVTNAAQEVATATVVVRVNNLNNELPPRIHPQSLVVAENSPAGIVVGTVIAYDPDPGDSMAYAITAGNTNGAFAINPTTGQLVVANGSVLDFETAPSFALTVRVTDTGGHTDAATVTVNLSDVNEAPTIADQAFSLDENKANGTVVATVVASDPDATDSLTWSITSGNTGGAFAINAATGQLTVNDRSVLDFETTPAFALTVQVTDSGGLTDTATVTVNLNNLDNETPPTIAAQWFAVDENAANGTVVGAVAASDPDPGDSLTYTITAGNTGDAFAINTATGQLTVANGSAVDFETAPSFALTIQVADTGGLTDTATVTIALNDLDEAPAIADQAFSVDENAGNATVVGTVVPTNPDAGDTLAWSITAGNTDGAFAIDAASGEITVANGSALNYETAPTFALTVQAQDAGGLTGTATVTINLNDVNEPPTVEGATFSVDENAASGTAVGTPLAASDPDEGDAPTFAITAGNTGNAFAIDPATGQITVNDSYMLDFEVTPTFTLTVQVSDPGGLTATATVTINLNDLNEALALASQSFAVDENSAAGTVVGTVTASGPHAGHDVTYSITAGNTGDAFAINSTTGQITVANTSALDFETTPTFSLIVQAQDTCPVAATAKITISLNDVNEAPAVADQTFTIDENSANGTLVSTIAVADPDAGDSLTWSITSGNTNGAFALDAATGEITVNDGSLLDYENTPSFSLTVQVTDSGGLTATAAITLDLCNVNEPPTVEGATFSLDENSADGTVVGTVTASDPDEADTPTYAITAGNTGNAFAIDPATGQITVNDRYGLDFEATPSFSLTVQAADPGGLTGTATVTINLNDLTEDLSLASQSFSVEENSAAGTVVGTVTATGPGAGQGVTYSITVGNTGGAFAINSTTGQITVANQGALNFEATPAFSLIVQAAAGGLTATAKITINLNDVNEAPTIAGQAFTIPENASNTTMVGTVAATDPDAGDSLSYTITAGNTGGAFAINSVTGTVWVMDGSALDFETAPTFSLTVQASDSGGLTSTANVTVSLTDVNEPPTIADQTVTTDEDPANGTVVGTVAAADPDAGDSLSFSITDGNTGGAFAIDNTGALTVANAAALDYETTPTFTLTVQVASTDGRTASAAVSVNLNNVNDAPVLAAQAFTVDENVPNGTLVETVQATDPDANDTLTYTITAGNTGGAFAINPATGAITVTNRAALDFETVPTFSLTVQVSDAGGLTDTATITINLNDLNEPPVIKPPFSFNVNENADFGTLVGPANADDPDGDTLTYSIVGGTGGNAFSIDADTGNIMVAVPELLDFDTSNSLSIDVQVTDPEGLADTRVFIISINDMCDDNTRADDGNLYPEVGIRGVPMQAGGQQTNHVSWTRQSPYPTDAEILVGVPYEFYVKCPPHGGSWYTWLGLFGSWAWQGSSFGLNREPAGESLSAPSAVSSPGRHTVTGELSVVWPIGTGWGRARGHFHVLAVPNLTVEGLNDSDEVDPGAFLIRKTPDADGRRKITLSCAYVNRHALILSRSNSKIEVYDRYNNRLTFNGTDNRFPANTGSCGVSVELWVEGVENSNTLRDIVLTLAYDTAPFASDPAAQDSVRLTVVEADLDIDSDNTNGIDPQTGRFQDPDLTPAEDDIENIQNDPKHPGKLIQVNDNDSDGDGIPDYADGFDHDGGGANTDDDLSSGDAFVPIRLQISNALWDLPNFCSQGTITFTYDDSPPNLVTRNADGVYTVPTETSTGWPPVVTKHRLRIWTVDANTKRKKNSVIAPESPGHFIPRGVAIPVSALGLSAYVPTTLYVEALDHSASVADAEIKVDVDPHGTGPICPDIVRSTLIRLEFVIPSAYDEASGLPAANAAPVPTNFVGVSDPRPTVTLDGVSSSQVVISGGAATVTLRGVVRDPIADNVPRGKVSAGKADIDSVTISVDGQPYGPNGPGSTQAFTIPVAASDEPGRKGFWCQHPYKGTFGPVTVAIPLTEGTHIIRVETSENAAGNKGFDEVAVTLEKREIPGTGPSDADTTGPAAVLNLYLPQAPAAQQADTLQYFRGERDPAPDDPTLTETQADSLAFAGVINGLQTEITLLNFTGLTAQGDTLTARIRYTIAGVQTSQDLTLTETGPETRLFRFRFADPTPETLEANIYLPVSPTPEAADVLQYYYGLRSPLPDDPIFTEGDTEADRASLVFGGTCQGVNTTIAIDPTSFQGLTANVDCLQGTIKHTFAGGATVRVAAFAETGVVTRIFRAAYAALGNSPEWTPLVAPGERTVRGAYSPVTMKVTGLVGNLIERFGARLGDVGKPDAEFRLEEYPEHGCWYLRGRSPDFVSWVPDKENKGLGKLTSYSYDGDRVMSLSCREDTVKEGVFTLEPVPNAQGEVVAKKKLPVLRLTIEKVSLYRDPNRLAGYLYADPTCSPQATEDQAPERVYVGRRGQKLADGIGELRGTMITPQLVITAAVRPNPKDVGLQQDKMRLFWCAMDPDALTETGANNYARWNACDADASGRAAFYRIEGVSHNGGPLAEPSAWDARSWFSGLDANGRFSVILRCGEIAGRGQRVGTYNFDRAKAGDNFAVSVGFYRGQPGAREFAGTRFLGAEDRTRSITVWKRVYLKGPDGPFPNIGVANVEGQPAGGGRTVIEEALAKVFIERKWRENTAQQIPATIEMAFLDPRTHLPVKRLITLDPYGPVLNPAARYDSGLAAACRMELMFLNNTKPPLDFKQLAGFPSDVEVVLLRAPHSDGNLIAPGAPEPYQAGHTYTDKEIKLEEAELDTVAACQFGGDKAVDGMAIYADVVGMTVFVQKTPWERTMAAVFLHELGHILLRRKDNDGVLEVKRLEKNTLMRQTSFAAKADVEEAAAIARNLDWGKDVSDMIRGDYIPNEPLPK